MISSTFNKLASLQASNEVWKANFTLKYVDWEPCATFSVSSTVEGRTVVNGYPAYSNVLGMNGISESDFISFPCLAFRIEWNNLHYSEKDSGLYYRQGAKILQDIKLRVKIKDMNNNIIHTQEFFLEKDSCHILDFILISSENIKINNSRATGGGGWQTSVAPYIRWTNEIRTPLTNGLYTVDVAIFSETPIIKQLGDSTQSSENGLSVNDIIPTLYIGDYEKRLTLGAKSYESVFCKCLNKINYVYPRPENVTGRGIVLDFFSSLKTGSTTDATIKNYVKEMPAGVNNI